MSLSPVVAKPAPVGVLGDMGWCTKPSSLSSWNKHQGKGTQGTVGVVVPGRVTVGQEENKSMERWGERCWHHVEGHWGWGGQRWGSDTSHGLRNRVRGLVLLLLEGGLGPSGDDLWWPGVVFGQGMVLDGQETVLGGQEMVSGDWEMLLGGQVKVLDDQ